MECQYCNISCPNILILNTHVLLTHCYAKGDYERPDNDWNGSVEDEDIYHEVIT